jgi:citrate lyase subunit beta/citryl-CoA lyase
MAEPAGHALARARSLLFVPGHAPQRFDRALASGADAVILDLEDAVAPQDKARAREHVAVWLRGLDSAARARVLVRLNASDAPNEHAADLAWLRGLGTGLPAGLVVPKAAHVTTLSVIAQAAGAPVALLPLVESADGWAAADALARAPQVLRLVFGHLDFQLDMGMECGPGQDELLPVRLALVAASRRAGLATPVDGVSPDLQDDTLTRADVARSRRLGFGGKLCIHPRQVPLVHEGLAPSEAELDWARRVLLANAQAAGAVFQLDGRMVDAPVLRKAERLLDVQPFEQSRST